MKMTQSLSAVFLMFLLSGCDLGTTPSDQVQDERAVNVAGDDGAPQNIASPTPDNADPQGLAADSLAITTTMSTELRTDLLATGLNEGEAQIIVNQAHQEATLAADSLAIFTLTSGSAVLNQVAPAFLKGAMAGLALADNGLSGSQERAQTAEVVMNASMKSLKTHTKGWSGDERESVETALTTSGVENIQAAGVSVDDHAAAVYSVVKGAVSALEKSGVAQSDLAAVAERTVETSLGSLSSLDDSVKVSSMAQVSKGSVVALSDLSLSDLEREKIPGTMAAKTTTAVHGLSLANDKLASAVADISYQTGVALQGAGLVNEAAKVAAIESVATSVSEKLVALKKTEASKDAVIQVIPQIGASLIKSLDSGLIASDNLVSSDVSSRIIQKTLVSLKDGSLSSEQTVRVLGDVTDQAVQAIQGAKIDSSQHAKLLSNIVEGAVGSLGNTGLQGDDALQDGLGEVTSRAVSALTATAVAKDAYDDSVSQVVSSAISSVSTSVDLGQSITVITEQSMKSLVALQESGAVSAETVLNAAKGSVSEAIQGILSLQSKGSVAQGDTEKLVVSAANGVMLGLAVGGATAAETALARDAVVEQVEVDLTASGASSEKVTVVKASAKDKADEAVEVADVIENDSAPACSLFASSVSDEDFRKKVDAEDRDKIFCKGNTCPVDRVIETKKLTWSVFSTDKALCAMASETVEEEEKITLTGGRVNLSSVSSQNVVFKVDVGNLTEVRFKIVAEKDSCKSRSLYSDWHAIQQTDYTVAHTFENKKSYVLCVDGKRNFQLHEEEDIVSASFDGPVGPTGASISIAAGAGYTSDATPSLTLAATDVAEMYITNASGCSSGGSWEYYATSKSWTLGQTNATATVYVKYRDGDLVESDCVSDSIVHDDTAPTSVSILISNGDSDTNDSAPDLAFAATGAAEMYITNTANCSSGGSWESYGPVKSDWSLTSTTNGNQSVYAKFRDEAGNESSCVSDSINFDNVAPTSTSINIAGGASSTNDSSPDLTLVATGATKMYITNDSGCSTGGTWEDYAAAKADWNLASTNSTQYVYVKFKDTAANESSCVQDDITYDTDGPSATSISIANGVSDINDSSPDLALSATGATEMYITNDSGCSTGGSWESYATSKTDWNLSSMTNGTQHVYAKFRDAAGNESSCEQDDVNFDNTPPTASSISIANDADDTNDTTPDLTLSATGATQMYITNDSGCSTGGSWENYATSKTDWSLTSGDGSKTVYAKYQDDVGNETACVNDAINLDTTAPTGSFSISSGNSYSTSSNVSLSLSVTGATEMYISNDDCSTGGSWGGYNASPSTHTLSSGDGTKTVYVNLRDDAGNTYCANDDIELDTTAPGDLSTPTILPQFLGKIKLNGFDSSDSGSGLKAYHVALGTSSGGTDIIGWTDIGINADLEWTTSNQLSSRLTEGTTYYLSLKAEDNAGNYSNVLDVNFVPSHEIIDISSKSDFNCALTESGTVKCWGANAQGQLGLGDTNDRGGNSGDMGTNLLTLDLGTGRTAKQVAVGFVHACAILDDDSVKCWGNNSSGQLGLGHTSAAGSVASQMGDNLQIVDLGSARTALDISLGQTYTCALLDDGSVKCWGNNNNGQLGQGNTTSVGSGSSQLGDYLSVVDLGTGKTAKDLSVGMNHACVILNDDSVKCWGKNDKGQLGQGTSSHLGDNPGEMGDNLSAVDLGTNRTAVLITAGDDSTCVLLDNDDVKCWGANYFGSLGLEHGNIVGDGSGEMGDNLPAVDLGSSFDVEDIVFGASHVCAISNNNELQCWGENDEGELGLGHGNHIGDGGNEMGDNLSIVDVNNEKALHVAIGGDHTCAVLEPGIVKCWGKNGKGQLGNESTSGAGLNNSEMGVNLPRTKL